MRVVIDTNVFINGIFKGNSHCKAIFQLKELNKLAFVMNQEMQNELIYTFYNILLEAFKKKKIRNKEFKALPYVASFSKCLWQVEEIDHVIKTDYCTEDKSDNKFIDCCIDGNVRYLITQDTHINSISFQLEKEHGIIVLSPLQFYNKYKNHQL